MRRIILFMQKTSTTNNIHMEEMRKKISFHWEKICIFSTFYFENYYDVFLGSSLFLMFDIKHFPFYTTMEKMLENNFQKLFKNKKNSSSLSHFHFHPPNLSIFFFTTKVIFIPISLVNLIHFLSIQSFTQSSVETMDDESDDKNERERRKNFCHFN